MGKRKLRWGETPFDRMDRAELLRFARRAYAALDSARSALSIIRGPCDERDPFWGAGGTGGDALSYCRIVLTPFEKDADDIYRFYFRPAGSLLWPELPKSETRLICDNCGQWIAQRGSTLDLAHPAFLMKQGCPPEMRQMTLADVAPITPTPARNTPP
jgi:hypothetical protein